MSYHLTIPLYRKDLCQSCMGENYTTTTLSPTRIYYLSLVDPTSCFSQRYFLYIARKLIVIPLYRQERKLQLFYFSNQLYTLNFRTKAPFVHWVHRQSISTISSLVKFLRNIALNSKCYWMSCTHYYSLLIACATNIAKRSNIIA